MGIPTGYTLADGTDIGMNLVEKSYLIDRYPELANTFKQAGLWLWGRSDYGQLGDNNVVSRSSPVQTVASGTNWKLISCYSNITAAIKTDGTLWTWGTNGSGSLGDNTAVNKSSPVQTIAGGTNWKSVAPGGVHVGAIKTDGTLWTWGRNDNGQLGNNSSLAGLVGISSPVQTVSGGTNWKLVTCGTFHTAAIKTDGRLWLWGQGTNGGLGDNTLTSRSSPVQTVSGGTNWNLVACGVYHTATVKTDGTLWVWGGNADGQLGDNTSTTKSSPVQTITGSTNWKFVATGLRHTAAIKTDGSLWLWGSNTYGRLGNNSTTRTSSPIQTVSGGTNWKSVTGGTHHTAAIKTDGTLWTWGYNNFGQLGRTPLGSSSSPAQVISAGTNWKQVSAGGIWHTAAIRDDSSDLFGDPI
jgi:alpha-tubulin suppressor-like RCC1 family protein